jgi:acyl-CoA oxidase
MGNEEQVKQYLKKSVNFEIVGCYAQTELGHGSDVRSLETTATFDEKTQEFVINTPSISAAKFWPG